ncbi:MAG TPA: hypothetical protein VGN42_16460 [Pirellulales bacterium]|nr:hypothetical protein [Pirellulales bacterium]
MKLTKSAVIVDYRLVASFESVKQKLLRPKFADRLDKPLAYWVVATDRRLPLAFMGVSLRELLDTPLEELFATAGIGQKKIHTLISLLTRASLAQPPGAVAPLTEEALESAAAPVGSGKRKGAEIDPTIVSEALWVEWRASVREHGFGQETLGRYVSTLQQLPRVIWNAPLESYLELSLAEIRALKTHGEKRVGAVLEVFGNLHKIVVHLGAQKQLGVRILPRFVIELENWVLRYLQRAGAPSYQELRSAFVAALLDQVRIDAGPQIAKLAESRLGPSGATVRQAAQRLGLTRARIYQLLGEVSTIVKVRWPEGPALVVKLRERLDSQGADNATMELLDRAIELFFSGPNELPTPFLTAAEAPETEPPRLQAPHRTYGHSVNGHGTNGHAGELNGGRTSPAKSNGPRAAARGDYR